MTAIDESTELSWHLQGNFAPVADEVTVGDLEVRGELPDGLNGTYIRGGFNPQSGHSDHWFFGNGMLHAVTLGDGTASYRNRYVRTPYYLDDMDLMTAMGDLRASPAGTNVVGHAGRILALEEAHLPWEVTVDCETIDSVDFAGRLATPMTAHPKICPDTGEMLFFGYQFLSEPWLTYHRADPSGTLVQSEVVELPMPVMMHDFAVTRNHAIFMDLPLVFELEKAGFHFDPDRGARLGVMPRNGSGSDVRWYEVDPCYVFHVVNAHEEGDRIVLHVSRFPEVMGQGMDDIAGHYPTLWRWTIDTSSGAVKEEQLDDRYGDFCRIDDRYAGLPTRYGYLQSIRPNPSTQEFGPEVYRYDLESGACDVHDLGPTTRGGEPLFVPRSADAVDGDGWVVLIAHDEAAQQSRFVVVDSEDFTGDPVAEVLLPQRVPYGPHGNWF